ncbi:MAG: glycosyltransferase family 2 protein [Clostridiales bacterium]|nr:glycosyltransferase family 2 protein [Clostridiales bacterium]
MNKISLCMIVRNEARNIIQCLEHALPFVDEVVIVDTGSTDATIEICEKKKIKVYSFPWENDFSKARNYSIEIAKYDWILCLDADEEVIIEDPIAFKESLTNNQDLFYVQMQHYETHNLDNLNNSHVSYHFRLFNKSSSLTYEGKIHERLQISNKMRYTLNKFIKINHFGYGQNNKNEKCIRNLTMLLEDWNKTPDNMWLNYHIASEFFKQNEISTAYKMVNRALQLSIDNNCKPPAIYYKLKYEILLYARTTVNVLESLEKAILLYPDYIDLYFYKGIVLERTAEYKEAIKTFQLCLIPSEVNCGYLYLVGVNSFLSSYHIYLCYSYLHLEKEAERELEQINMKYPLLCNFLSSYENLYI